MTETPDFKKMAVYFLKMLPDKPKGEYVAKCLSNLLEKVYSQGLEKGVSHFGPPCEKHKKVVAWLAPTEGQVCFGCYIESVKKQAFEAAREVMSNE